eukprot:COSAG02_NODE_31605_length_530_cov_1.858469_1_plen_47_part_01
MGHVACTSTSREIPCSEMKIHFELVPTLKLSQNHPESQYYYSTLGGT